ncbi:FHA domain-containing protein [Azospirillum baldaniorum]|uniref:FHA domain-containing protein n=1 Tax=Azospirillum baldaniorum TaxID=1064539 RepID=UPI001FCA8E92|nr:FHA domain-containing protein [Azospirillum baldaniorum]
MSKAAAERLVLFWRGQTRAIPEDGTQLVIGRSSQCQFVLDIASASRRHAAVSRQDGVFVVEDLSRNGTQIAVPGVAEPRRLKAGEPLPLPPRGEIVIGSTELGEEPARIAWEIVKR